MSETGYSRSISDRALDDHVLPFSVESLDVRGRAVRLAGALDQILTQHAYPPEIARLVGEAAVLTVMLGSSLNIEGRFQLQTRSDGLADMLVVDFDAPDRLRAFARFNTEALAEAREKGAVSPAQLLGRGHLAFTIDRGPHVARYQGVVVLEGQGLEAAAHQYFAQSEQIPTLVRLAVGEVFAGPGSARSWRGGGLLVQFLPDSPERRRQADLHPGDAPDDLTPQEFHEDDAWSEAKVLATTAEDHELLDPQLSSERLLYRLFHERGVKVFEPAPVRHQCRCTRENVEAMLRNFPDSDRRDMVGEDGRIGVTCEFCGVKREFDPADFDSSPQQ